MRSGDKYKTNRMFRRRIYAQGFTILAMLAGSVYWEGDRSKRRQYDALVAEREKKEKHEKWIRELEIREEEEEELRKIRDSVMKGQRRSKTEERTEEEKRKTEAKNKEELGQPKGGLGVVRSVLEEDVRRGRILVAARELWERRR